MRRLNQPALLADIYLLELLSGDWLHLASGAVRAIGKGALWLAIAVLSVALGGALSWYFSTADLTRQASELDKVDLTLGSVAVTRATAAQAVLVAVNHSTGVAGEESLAAALAEVVANVDALGEVAVGLPVGGEVGALQDAATAVVELIRAGSVEAARTTAESEIEASYREAVDALTTRRAVLVGALESGATTAGRVGSGLRVAAVVAIPLLVMLIMASSHKRKRRAERADFLAAVEEAVAGEAASDAMLLDASHRFRTPLTSIYGLADVLAQSKRISRLERELVSLVHAEAADLYRIADDVLVATQHRTDSLRAAMEIMALAPTVEEAVKPIRATGVEIKVDCPEVWVLSDPAKVRQIVRNLVANAAQHGAEPIFVEVSEADGRVECVIVDHGDGLAEGCDPNSRSFPDRGLGLRVAYVLSDLIDARLHYQRDGDRSRFVLSFIEDGAPQTMPTRMAELPRPLSPSADAAE